MNKNEKKTKKYYYCVVNTKTSYTILYTVLTKK